MNIQTARHLVDFDRHLRAARDSLIQAEMSAGRDKELLDEIKKRSRILWADKITVTPDECRDGLALSVASLFNI